MVIFHLVMRGYFSPITKNFQFIFSCVDLIVKKQNDVDQNWYGNIET